MLINFVDQYISTYDKKPIFLIFVVYTNNFIEKKKHSSFIYPHTNNAGM
jgi:hypothetical protein